MTPPANRAAVAIAAAAAVAVTGLAVATQGTKEQAALSVFQQRRAVWIDGFQASGRDARGLPRAALLASYAPPQPTSAAAAAAADVIVAGHVASVRFTPSGTETVFQVTSAVTGAAGGTVAFTQSGGPEPGPDFVDGTLAYAENAPLLVTGDAAVLLLDRVDGRLEVQSFTGHYAVAGGRVTAVEANPFKASVDGLTADELLALLRRALGE